MRSQVSHARFQSPASVLASLSMTNTRTSCASDQLAAQSLRARSMTMSGCLATCGFAERRRAIKTSRSGACRNSIGVKRMPGRESRR